MGMPAVNMVENCRVNTTRSFSVIFRFLGPKSLREVAFAELDVTLIPCFLRMEASSSLLPAAISPVLTIPAAVFPVQLNVFAMRNYETKGQQKQELNEAVINLRMIIVAVISLPLMPASA